MNDLHDIPEEETGETPLWKRLWPILLGIVVALGLASGGYWLGLHSSGQSETSVDDGAYASGSPSSFAEASAPEASAGVASAPEASGVVFQGAFSPSAALHAIFGETVKKGSASFARWTEVFLPQTDVFQPYLGSGPMLVSPLGVFPLQEAGESRQLILFQSVPEARPAGSRPEGAIIGAAVFRPLGNGWQEVRETRAITAAGAYGQAPAGRPVVLGPTQLGLQFEGSYSNQGETLKYALLIEQNEQGFAAIGPVFDMGRDNSGSCASASPAVPCYGYSGLLRFNNTVSGGHYLLDFVQKGTRPNSEGGVDSFVDVRQYRYQNGTYEEDATKHVLKIKPVPVAEAGPASAAEATTASNGR